VEVKGNSQLLAIFSVLHLQKCKIKPFVAANRWLTLPHLKLTATLADNRHHKNNLEG